MTIRNTVLLFSVFAIAACSTAPQKPKPVARGDYTYTRQYISWFIEKQMRENNVTGLSIALVDDQQIIWSQGFGYEDKRAGIRATPGTVYHLGSIAKVLTATAAMQLAEQGRMDIDRPLKKYLPEFSIRSRFAETAPVTPRNIMTHHSGLPSNFARGMSVRNPEPFTNLVGEVRNEYMAFPPNYVFDYSNLGVALLGAAIGRASGEGYVPYMTAHILKPLEMDHSAFIAKIPGKAYNGGKVAEAVPLRDLPSGGLNSSAQDMSHFMQMVFAGGKYNGRQIVKPETLAEMMRPQNANVPLDLDFRIGLGWNLNTVDVPLAGVVASHGGTTLYYHTIMAVLPEHKLGVVVLSNSATAQGMVEVVAAETLKLALEAKAGIVQPEKRAYEIRTVGLTEADIRYYEGYFDTLIGLVKVSGASGSLTAEVMGYKFALMPRGNGEFGVRFKLFGLIPIRVGALEELDEVSLSLLDIQGHKVLALKRNGRSTLVGEKIKTNPIPEEMRDVAGEYEIIGKLDGPMPDRVWISQEDGMLIGELTFAEKPGFVFRTGFNPISATELVTTGIGSGKGEELRLEKVGNEQHIFYSGFELRKKSGAEKRG